MRGAQRKGTAGPQCAANRERRQRSKRTELQCDLGKDSMQRARLIWGVRRQEKLAGRYKERGGGGGSKFCECAFTGATRLPATY